MSEMQNTEAGPFKIKIDDSMLQSKFFWNSSTYAEYKINCDLADIEPLYDLTTFEHIHNALKMNKVQDIYNALKVNNV